MAFSTAPPFHPNQPTIPNKHPSISYQEIKPAEALQKHIHCYWRLNTKNKLAAPFNYRVVSDGCIDVFFNHKNPEESFVMGFCHKYTEFSIGQEFDYAGIRFYPAMVPWLFGISAKSLSDQDQVLEKILPELAIFIAENMKEDFESSIEQLNTYLTAAIKKTTTPIDERFYSAYQEILQQKGNLEIENDLNTGLSPRQLRRLFNFYIGTSPKSFCQVIRFQYILHAKPSAQSLRENKIFYEVGFFDQAHFIKNFTKFYGVTPSKAFR